MIGGTDFIIQVRQEIVALDWAVRAITRLWPNLVLEDADTGEVLPAYQYISFTGRKELLAFKDQKSAKLWDEIGVDPSLAGTLVHFLLSPGELTVSVDDKPPPEIKSFVDSLRSSLYKDLFASVALPMAAT